METVGRYTIVRKLGEGGMGVVYLATDPVLGRQAAIKTIRLDDSIEPDQRVWMRDRFMTEARIVARLYHSSIVVLHDFFEQGGLLFIVMEFVHGESLSSFLGRTPGPLPPPGCLRILRDAASGLDYAHSQQVVHRDIKPANLLIDASGVVKITDFGIAKLAGSSTRTTANTVMGTLDYMAPEQIKGEPVDGRADQFSLAVVAYRLLTGRRLFESDSFVTLSYKMCNDAPQPPSKLVPELGRGVDRVFARALSKSPDGRYSSCTEFVEELAAELEKEPWTAYLPVPASPLPFGSAGAPQQAGPGATAVFQGAEHAGPQATAAAPSLAPAPMPAPVAHWPPRPKRPRLPRTRIQVMGTGVAVAVVAIGSYVATRPGPIKDPAPTQAVANAPSPAPASNNVPATPVDAAAQRSEPVNASPAPVDTPVQPQAPAATPTASTQRVKVAAPTQEGKLIRKIVPVYPKLARDAHVQGAVLFSVVIAPNGTIRSLQLVRGHPMLVEAAGNAVKQWRYKPTLVNGRPVEVTTMVEVNFKLTIAGQ